MPSQALAHQLTSLASLNATAGLAAAGAASAAHWGPSCPPAPQGATHGVPPGSVWAQGVHAAAMLMPTKTCMAPNIGRQYLLPKLARASSQKLLLMSSSQEARDLSNSNYGKAIKFKCLTAKRNTT
jgi:hypothetical protein